MIGTSIWKRTGVLIVGFISYGFCVWCGELRNRTYMVMVAGEDSWRNLRLNEEVLYLRIIGYRLGESLIRKNLGKWFPNLERVDIEKVPSCGVISREDSASEVVPCEKVEELVICDPCNGSPTMFEHMKALFPRATNLTIESSEGMPIQNSKDAETCQEKELMMEGVKKLLVGGGSAATAGILIENLRLFPSVEDLSFSGDILKSITGEDIRKTDLVLSHVKKLDGRGFPMDQGFLSGVSKLFPSVEELLIGESKLERMTARVEEGTDPHLFFEKLTKLEIYSYGGSATSCFGERTREVFPVLSSLLLRPPSVDALKRPKDIIAVETVKTVKIRCGRFGCPPDFFDELFPELTSLIMSKRGFKRLSSGKPFFHPQLRDLDISGNEDLEKILEGMEEPEGGSSEAPVGGLDLPCLESLDISGSFECKIPGWFLQGCPRIRRLKVTVDPERYSWDSKRSWWEFLRPLSELEELHVGIAPSMTNFTNFDWDGYELQDNSGFSGNMLQDILKGLSRDLIEVRKFYKLHASIHFHKHNEFITEHVTSIGPPDFTKRHCFVPSGQSQVGGHS